MANTHTIILTAMGVLLALLIRWLFWAAIGSTFKWAVETFGVCSRCGEQGAKFEFVHQDDSDIICRDCAQAAFGPQLEETIRRGYLKIRRWDR